MQCAQALCYLGFNRDIFDMPFGARPLAFDLFTHGRDLGPNPIGKVALHPILLLRRHKNGLGGASVPQHPAGKRANRLSNRCKSQNGALARFQNGGQGVTKGSPADSSQRASEWSQLTLSSSSWWDWPSRRAL